jgi:hypothetical protein
LIRFITGVDSCRGRIDHPSATCTKHTHALKKLQTCSYARPLYHPSLIPLPTKWPHGAKGRQCLSTPFGGAFAWSLMPPSSKGYPNVQQTGRAPSENPSEYQPDVSPCWQMNGPMVLSSCGISVIVRSMVSRSSGRAFGKQFHTHTCARIHSYVPLHDDSQRSARLHSNMFPGRHHHAW